VTFNAEGREAMAESEARGLRRQMAAKLREFEGQLLKLEGELLILRGKAARVTEDAEGRLAALLAEVEQETEALRRAGQRALDGLGRAAESGQAAVDRVRGLVAQAETLLPPLLPGAARSGREVLRRASIEARAVRHGVRVGLRVARRAARRVRAGRTGA
jgi:hypothetical protein